MPVLTIAKVTSARLVARGLGFAALYFAAMIASIMLARFGGQVTPIWVASAVFAWALLTSAPSQWWAYIGLTTIAHIAGAISVGDQWQLEIPYLIANLASPIICAALLRQEENALAFEHRNKVLRFLLICGVIAPGVSASIVSLAGVLQTGDITLRNSIIWYFSDGLSFVVFLPIINAVTMGDWRTLAAPETRGRATLMFALLIASLVGDLWLRSDLHRIYLLALIPYLIFMTFELGLMGARAAIVVVSLVLLIGGLLMPSRLDAIASHDEYIFALQIYVAAVCASVLPLAGALAEKQAAYESASEALHEAQAAWGDLLAAEAHYRLLADHTSDMLMRLDLKGAILFASPAARVIAARPERLIGAKLADLAPEEDAQRLRERLTALIAKGELDRPMQIPLRLRGVNGDLMALDLRATLIAPSGGVPEEIIAVLREARP